LHAIYLDSGRARAKHYTNIKSILDVALIGFAKRTGTLKVERKIR
jgi:hypothetical protein